MGNDNVRTLDFTGDTPQVMPEDVFEGRVLDDSNVDYAGAVPQFTDPDDGVLVTGDFGPQTEPLTAVSLHRSEPFVYIEIPSLGIEVPLSIDVATSLFDTLGAAINAL